MALIRRQSCRSWAKAKPLTPPFLHTITQSHKTFHTGFGGGVEVRAHHAAVFPIVHLPVYNGTYQEAELPELGEGEAIDTSIPADPNVKNYSACFWVMVLSGTAASI